MPACKTCGGSFTWRRIGEKWHAIDPDGATNHWSYCLGRGKKRNQAPRPETRGGELITGEHYRPSCGRCDVPPWQSCACSALLEPDRAPRGTAERVNAEAQMRLSLALENIET